jgi:hypothetical protein
MTETKPDVSQAPQEPPEEEVLTELPGADQSESALEDDGMADLLEYPGEADLPELNDEDELLEYPDELPDEELWDDSIMLDEEEEPLEEVLEPESEPEQEPPGEAAPQTPIEKPQLVFQQEPPQAPKQNSPAEGPEQKGLSETAMLNLFQYLKNLTEELPEDQKRAFKASEARLKMEYVIDKLEGHKGLLKSLAEKTNPSKEPVVSAPMMKKPDPESVAKTLAYLSSLVKTLPDKDLTHVIEKKVNTVVKGLVSDGGHRE